MIIKHYESIQEEYAKLAKQAYSFFDYKEGSATANYKQAVDECYEIACKAAEKKPKEEERIQRLFDTYVQKLAENINAQNRNTASCPSVMISGAGNFPVHKKEKQIARDEKLMVEYNHIAEIPEKIRAIALNNTIYADGVDAIEQLEEKAEKCREALEKMKEENINARKEGREKPYPDWALTSLRTKMKNALDRAEKLKNIKTDDNAGEVCGEGYKLIRNAEKMRIQFIFDGKPDAEIITALKQNGFRWAPSEKAWQRQLTENGERAAQEIIRMLEE